MNLVPGATYVPLSPALLGQRARRKKGRGACAHVAVSESPRLVPSSSSADWHLYIPRVGPTFYQFIDLDLVCYAQLNGNGSLVGWETQGGVQNPEGEPWSDFQIQTQAHIMRYLHDTEGVPLQVMPDSKPTSRGLGYHKLGVDPFRAAGGELWSSARGKICPGLKKISQIPDIIRIAQNGEDDMPLTDDDIRRIWEYNYKGGPWVGDRIVGIDDKTGASRPQAIADAVLDTKIERSGPLAQANWGPDSETTLRGVVSWSDENLMQLGTQFAKAFSGGDPKAIAEAMAAALPADLARQVADEFIRELKD